MAYNSSNNELPLYRMQSVDSAFHNAPPRILMTQTGVISSSQSSGAINQLTDGTLQRRTAEGVFQLRDNFNNVIRGFQPLVETARSVNASGSISISSFLNRPVQPEVVTSNQSSNSNSFVINLENFAGADNAQGTSNNLVNNQNNNGGEENAADNAVGGNPEETPADRIPTVAEAQQFLRVITQYIPFVIILLAKGLYDHHEGILNFLVLLVTFTHSNSVVKREATKRSRRNLTKLLLAFLYINICILFIHYIFEEEHLYLNLVFIRTYEKPLNMWDLLWVVGLTDFILKLITVMLKIVLTILPGKIVAFQKRGKMYLFMEAISQFYRSLAPIQPWLYYLLESYQGTEKIIGVFLSAAYMVSKGSDLVSKVKLMKMAIFKLLQNVAVGSSPSKDQIQTAGEHCPICHDEYDSPVLLQCRHIFCESCVTTWFDREQTCPLCRAKIVDDPSWRDGSTTFFMQLF